MLTSKPLASQETLDKPLGTDNVCLVPYVNIPSDVEFARARQANKRRLLRSERERFWSKVNTDGPIPIHQPQLGPCWIWTASAPRGYGQFVLARERNGAQPHLKAHRLAYELVHGPIASTTIKTCHRCDNPLCVRPSHLFLGTQQDNLADARAKGRLDESRPRVRPDGFTPRQRLEIFNLPYRRGLVVELARRYGVSKACISIIRHGRFVRPRDPMVGVFERVPHVILPVVGELHTDDSTQPYPQKHPKSFADEAVC